MESWGRGYKNISDICKLRKAKLPVPEENSGGLAVECPPSKEYLAAEKKQGKMVAKDGTVDGTVNGGQMGGQIGGQIKLGESQIKILRLIKENPSVSSLSLAESLGINQSAVQRHLEALKQNGLIARIGGTRGYWKFIETERVNAKNQ